MIYFSGMTKDFTPIYKRYKGRWVAMDDGFAKVVVSGQTSSTVYQKAKKKGYKIPNVFRVPSNLNAFIG